MRVEKRHQLKLIVVRNQCRKDDDQPSAQSTLLFCQFLLRTLQEGEYFKLGTSRPQGTNVRFIAATNVEPDKLQDPGLFRKDLFYRLCGAWQDFPPLRERKEDLELLVKEFLQNYGGGHG